eukprot:scaffold109743_cov70-Phaeocystis_antarctica.AAC.2
MLSVCSVCAVYEARLRCAGRMPTCAERVQSRLRHLARADGGPGQVIGRHHGVDRGAQLGGCSAPQRGLQAAVVADADAVAIAAAVTVAVTVAGDTVVTVAVAHDHSESGRSSQSVPPGRCLPTSASRPGGCGRREEQHQQDAPAHRANSSRAGV